MKHSIFPSVIEGHNSELRNVSPDLLNGMKIYEQGTGYIVGQLALREGNSPHKAINSSPEDLDYKLLLKSGLLLAAAAMDAPMTVTLGFPYATFQFNRDKVGRVIDQAREVTFDTATYGGKGRQTQKIEITKVDALPEIVGAIIGARKGPLQQSGAFFLVSLGYGTCEACLSTEDGILQRTMVSTSGIRYAIDLAMKELMQTHYLGLRTEHQFDAAFQRGKVILNRQMVDLRPVRRRTLERYYEDVVSPTLRNVWSDADFERSSTLILIGGGALYEDLVNAFIEEFGGLLDVVVADDPMSVASTGYCLRAASLNAGGGLAVGLDIGNAYTSVALSDESGGSRQEARTAERESFGGYERESSLDYERESTGGYERDSTGGFERESDGDFERESLGDPERLSSGIFQRESESGSEPASTGGSFRDPAEGLNGSEVAD